jgi:hypothetical protein
MFFLNERVPAGIPFLGHDFTLQVLAAAFFGPAP